MTKVTLPYDPARKASEWAKIYCPSYVTHTRAAADYPKNVPGGWVNAASIVYYFNDDRDAVLFSLRWL